MRILVTRPEPGGSETAARLEALGHQAVLLPLTEIRPLPVRRAPGGPAIGAVAVTSANAMRHASRILIAALARKPCYAVGARTAEAARAFGFVDVRSADADATALARMVVAEVESGACVAYICGRVRKPDFEAFLAKRGIRAVAIETYHTVLTNHSQQAAFELLGGKPMDVALVFSPMGAEALATLIRNERIAQLLAETRYLCLSPRVAESLGPVIASRAAVSSEPTEAALISLIGTGEAA